MNHSGYIWGSSDRSVCRKEEVPYSRRPFRSRGVGPLLGMGKRARENQKERGEVWSLPIQVTSLSNTGGLSFLKVQLGFGGFLYPQSVSFLCLIEVDAAL